MIRIAAKTKMIKEKHFKRNLYWLAHTDGLINFSSLPDPRTLSPHKPWKPSIILEINPFIDRNQIQVAKPCEFLCTQTGKTSLD